MMGENDQLYFYVGRDIHNDGNTVLDVRAANDKTTVRLFASAEGVTQIGHMRPDGQMLVCSGVVGTKPVIAIFDKKGQAIWSAIGD